MTAASEEGDIPTAARTEADLVKEEDPKTASDNDTAEPERPVRRKLQETRITSDGNPSVPNDDDEAENSLDDDRGRLKKRSHDDLQNEEEMTEQQQHRPESGHRRKRSRDAKDDDTDRQSTPEPRTNTSAHILSPKKKRSIDQLQEDGGSALSQNKPSVEESENARAEGERETKRYRDASKERQTSIEEVATSAKPSLPNAFLNTSAVSPFASLSSKSSEGQESKAKITSSSAFAASGLASFAGQEQSPFGALGKPANTPSVFSKPAITTATSEEKKPLGSGFAAASTTSSSSPFGNTGASGFAALGSGSGFGSGFGATTTGGFGASTGGKLSSFASATSSGFGGLPAKPFGAEQEADEEEEEEDGESKAVTGTFEKEKEDERFYEQQIETGEEDERTYFSCKAKLFHFSDKVWKERGVGTFKVNVKEPSSDESSESDSDNEARRKKKKSARMIMRADGVLRVMLNSPIFKGMPVGDVSGDEPKGKQLNLASVEDGKTVPLLLRLGNAESAKELYHVIIDLQKHM
ncbi:hypothetical protein UA08_07603 [Talaromyces atroroseus]|uniref:RanBD1 domain-containing protein n=1 Tax=Talaromyces atroroseus TaxID=1441469 RepID=A0A225A8X6_TALAT|nr:hypothetical protein UA08_07603 [Talaromyces atroroseus]OKL57261.1 hypothetical protein UA08_07603 [Talaromyces atroroseus]